MIDDSIHVDLNPAELDPTELNRATPDCATPDRALTYSGNNGSGLSPR